MERIRRISQNRCFQHKKISCNWKRTCAKKMHIHQNNCINIICLLRRRRENVCIKVELNPLYETHLRENCVQRAVSAGSDARTLFAVCVGNAGRGCRCNRADDVVDKSIAMRSLLGIQLFDFTQLQLIHIAEVGEADGTVDVHD